MIPLHSPGDQNSPLPAVLDVTRKTSRLLAAIISPISKKKEFCNSFIMKAPFRCVFSFPALTSKNRIPQNHNTRSPITGNPHDFLSLSFVIDLISIWRQNIQCCLQRQNDRLCIKQFVMLQWNLSVFDIAKEL